MVVIGCLSERTFIHLGAKRNSAESQDGNGDGLVNANPIPADETCPQGYYGP